MDLEDLEDLIKKLQWERSALDEVIASQVTPRMAADGMLQGAVLTHGRGRIAS
jgi:hypothetical protein